MSDDKIMYICCLTFMSSYFLKTWYYN